MNISASVCRIWTSGSGSRKKPWNKPHRSRQCNIRMFLKSEPSNFLCSFSAASIPPFGDAIDLDDLLHGQFLAVTEGEQVLTLCIQPRNGSPQIFKPEVLSAASSTGHLTPSQPDSAVSNAFLLRCLAPGFSCDCPRF